MTDRQFYPPIAPYDVFDLDVGDGHRLHVNVSGNPHGRPVVVLHGGPGAGCLSAHRRLFDPTTYRIILVDQRGAGRSTPLGSVDQNTTPHLTADLERLRERLRVGRWMLFGGSWGSTLALAYAADYPERVAAMILRGTWLARAQDVAWHMTGLRALAPDHWSAFSSHISQSEQDDLLEAYWRRLSSDDHDVQLAAALAWCAYEQHFATLVPAFESVVRSELEQIALARIEAHYFRNGCFLEPERLLAAVSRLASTPAVIIHGRYDWLARLEGAWSLSRAWPTAELHIVPDAAHSMFEPGIRSCLIAATDRFAQLAPWE